MATHSLEVMQPHTNGRNHGWIPFCNNDASILRQLSEDRVSDLVVRPG